MNKGHDKGHKGQMSDREVMKLALEALVDFGWHIENCPQFPTWAEPKKHPPCTCGYDTAITALRQALAEPDMGIDRGAWDDVPDATKWVDELRGGDEQPECNQHPDAPHGFNRESSHSLGRYVCDCEGWEPEQETVAWRNAAIRLGEDLYSVGPNWYYDMTASQWLDWALSVVNTAPPKPAQDLIVGYADSHDIARDGHDFWVSRQPGKNTVPLYLYGHPPKIWQGLTGDEVNDLKHWLDHRAQWSYIEFAHAIEAKLKEKNR